MEEIEELRAKVIASMSNPSSSAAKVKSPPSDAELASTRLPPNPSSTAAAITKSPDSDVELAANPISVAAANVKSPLSDVGSANPSPSAVDVAELASMPSSSPVEIKSPGGGDPGELASIPASAGKVKSPASREEGELSSASGEEVPELPTCSTVPSSRKTVDEPVVIAPRDKAGQSMKAANNFVGSGSCQTNMQLPVPITKNYSKHLKVKHGPFKSRNSRTISWNGKGSDDNLVIRFSNDDSESDSEDSNLGKNVRRKTNKEATFEIPVTSTRTHQKVLRRPPTNRTKPVQNKSVKSVSFTAYGRGSSYGKPVASSCEVDPRIQRHTSVTKPSPTQEHEHVQDANFTDRKLESLRHQIAIKENALKVHNNSMIQSEERLAGSFGDHQAAGIRRHFVTTNVVTPKEQPMKRLKLDGHPKSTFSDVQLQKAIPSPRFISEFYKDSHPMDCREGEGTAIVITDPISDRRRKEANKDNGIPSYALLNGTKDDEPLVLTSSRTMRYLDVPPKPNYTFAAEVSSGPHQFGLGPNPGDHSEVQNETFPLTHMEGTANDGALCQFVGPTGRNLSSESPRPSNIGDGGGVLLETSNQIFGKQVVHVRDPQLSDDDVNMSAMESVDLESLLKLEEQQDDELEQAQELRRKCEFEERRAMKAYRDAQRALVKANEKCSQLYRKREVFSAQLRALTMEASSSWCPSNWQNQNETVEVSPKIALTSAFGSSMGCQMLAGQVLDCSGCDYNDLCPDGAYQQTPGLVSDQCLEPNASRSAPTAANDICTTTNHSNMSADEDNVNFPFVRKSIESRSTSDVNGGKYEGNPTNMIVDREISPSGEIVRDYELLEATLRSKLVARLSARMPSTICDVSNTEYLVDKSEDTTGEKKKTSSLIGQRLVEREDLLTLETEGSQRPGRSYSQLSTHFPDESRGNTLCLTDELHRNVDRAEDISSLPSSNLQIISRHAEFILPDSCNGSSTTTEKAYRWSTAEEVGDCVLDFAESTKEFSSRSSNTGDRDSSICDGTIDPFRPFCIFELRGKCNNEECPWQHVRSSTNRTNNCSIHHVTTSSDDWFNPSLSCGNSNAHCPCHQNMQVPAYILGSDLIDIDSSLPGPLLARSNLRNWQRGLCGSFPSPFSVERILPSDALFLQSDDAPVADDYSRNRHFLRFRSQVDPMEQLKEGLPATEQSLEMALDLCDGENFYKPKMKKALALISRALEKDPTSVVSWVVYLHMYYGSEKEIGKEDLFLHAVQQNGGSYDLWLMYINSRERLGDRLQAYDFALTTFCKWKDTCDKDDTYTSACILDIFLQMVDFLCMSGNVDKAVSGFYQLLHTTQFENSGDTLCSRVHSHLTVSDKCIFWFCCIYVVIYGKLPEPVVQKFEFEKDPSYDIEWLYVQVPIDRKDMALELMKVCVDSMALDTDIDSHRRDQTVVRSLHFLVICHIRSVGVLEGLHFSTDLLVKYMKLYPSCIELVLMSARLQSNVRDDVFIGFEEALTNWPMETTGWHCIWNQYAQHVLENKGYESAEKLMSRWFQCYFKGKDPCTKNMGGVEDVPGFTYESPSVIQSDGSSSSLIVDDTFEFLNLSLYRRLQKNLPEARLAIDKALELAAPSDYEHCVREHAAFIFSNESELQRVSRGFICSLLNDHLGDSRASSSETLSRRYYRSIKKPRIRKFIDNILGSVSRDFSRMNSILEACYGSSLIPEKFGRPEDLVDLVEVLMERMPENYQVALSVCRYTWRNFSRTGIRFWAISIFVNSILQTVPVAPEHVWLEAANLIRNLEYSSISTRLHQQALSVYPFSVKLWQSYLDLSRITGNADAIVVAARERGLELVESVD